MPQFFDLDTQRESWVVAFWGCDPLLDWVWDWVALGWPKRGPRATQASRKGHPRVDLRKRLCLQQKLEKAGWGGKQIAGIADIAVIARDRKSEP